LTDMGRTLKSTIPGNSEVKMLSNTHPGNIKYLLTQAYSIADEAARSGNSDGPALVQIRGLLAVIEKELFGKKIG
jgi:hypothetical protein